MTGNYKVPGLKANHQIITDGCASVHGDHVLALDEAFARLKKEFKIIIEYDQPSGTKYHLVLYIERPDRKK